MFMANQAVQDSGPGTQAMTVEAEWRHEPRTLLWGALWRRIFEDLAIRDVDHGLAIMALRSDEPWLRAFASKLTTSGIPRKTVSATK